MTASHALPAARALTTLCVLTAVLAACSILPKSETVQVWQPPENAATSANATGNFSLRVDTPNATGELEGGAMVVLPAPGKVSTYQGARWNNPPPLLVQQRLVDAFMAAKLPAVTTDEDHFVSDYTLSGNLRAFQTEYRAGAPVVVIRYDAQLRRGFSRHLLATHSFVVTQKPTDASVAQIVTAFGQANDALAAQVVTWVIDQAQRAPAPAGAASGRKH